MVSEARRRIGRRDSRQRLDYHSARVSCRTSVTYTLCPDLGEALRWYRKPGAEWPNAIHEIGCSTAWVTALCKNSVGL
jgi:hypothetical protein